MQRIITLMLFIALTAGWSLAQTQAQPPAGAKPAEAAKPDVALPSVDQILDKYVQAVGGKAAIEKLTSRVATGSFEIPTMNLTGTVELYAKAPNKSGIAIDITGFGLVQEGYDGKTAWAQDPASGMREKSGVELAAVKRDAEFYQPLKLKQLYPKMEVKSKEKVGEREAYVIIATPEEGDPEKLYFDAQTGLLVRTDIERESPQGKIPVEVYLEDYREVDGNQIPFTIRQITPIFSATIRIKEYKHNVPVDDAKFSKPSAP
jgi:hypothetical protein